jgi:hypothetical protein
MTSKRYSNAVTTQTNESDSDRVEPYMPCLECRHPTLRAILAQHGGRCTPCYDSYCRSGPCGSGESMRALTHADKLALLGKLQRLTRATKAGNGDDPRAWARRIIDNAEAGAHVAPSTLRMARAALPSRPTPPDIESGWE